jgi:streptomycin 6-kinase
VTEGDDLVAEWELHTDGDPVRGAHALVLPVRTSDGSTAVLKVGDAAHEHLVLRRWAGDGAVRLLRADPHRGAVLLERLRHDTLTSLSDVDACEIVAGLYSRLHVPAMPQLPSLTALLDEWAADFAALPRSASIPHRLVEQAITQCRELATLPADRVLHGNLHYDNVLAADREAWLAISPRPINGDPHFELAPMLWHRWGEIADKIRFGVQRRFFALIDAAGLDEGRARGYVLVRVVREATRDPENLTTYIALAKAVQD